ncbi:TetR/AcrR family transcriptional regulator [Undibacterium sp. Di27W]|uniref:TetR/AcrR family transcriptional regulator n=1 Tax=Undibacterium sp. Di27W TaxID=3413036 RepID=UPI003BF16EDF
MRKAPRQQRSQVMVNTILEAATRVLAQRGWANFKTNEVAEVAGISIGSLYQYFPDKLGLAEEIRKRHLSAVLAALSNSAHGEAATTLELRVTRLIDGVIAVHAVDQALHRVLLKEVPFVTVANGEEFEREYQGRYRELIAVSAGAIPNASDEVAARVLAAAVEGVVHAAARHGELKSALLKRELAHLVIAYLRVRA